MGKVRAVSFSPDAADHLIDRYLKITILRFTPEMAARLAEVRKEKFKCSQRQLAEQLGLSQTDICRLEAGKYVGALPTADRFKTVLDKYFSYVCFGGALLNENELTVEYNKQTRRWWGRLKK